MLLRFRVSNYASLREEQELSLITVDDHPDMATSPVPRGKLRALPVAGVFGQNASGKSNVLRALAFTATAVRDSHQRWLPDEGVPRQPFRLDSRSSTEPSTFILEMVVEGVQYEYGFAADDEKVRQEWLFAYPRGKRQVWFRRQDERLDFGNNLAGPRESIGEVLRPNSLFLSAGAANNHRQLSTIYRWFTSHQHLPPQRVARPPRTVPSDRLLRLLRFADLGIIGAEEAPATPEEQERLAALTRELQERYPTLRGLSVPGLETKVMFTHQADTGEGYAPLPWQAESTGTQFWWGLLGPAQHSLDQGTLLVVDDLGSGLHPLLTAQMIRLFRDRTTNPNGAQLLFNTHDTGLLGRHYGVRLARDQVWLTEKDRNGVTRLFPLTEFRVRDGVEDVEGRYLKGRYGAVPFFDEDLLAELTNPDEPTP